MGGGERSIAKSSRERTANPSRRTPAYDAWILQHAPLLHRSGSSAEQPSAPKGDKSSEVVRSPSDKVWTMNSCASRDRSPPLRRSPSNAPQRPTAPASEVKQINILSIKAQLKHGFDVFITCAKSAVVALFAIFAFFTFFTFFLSALAAPRRAIRSHKLHPAPTQRTTPRRPASAGERSSNSIFIYQVGSETPVGWRHPLAVRSRRGA